MDINFGFEATEADLSTRRLLPAGEYTAQLVDVDQVESRSGHMRTVMTFSVIDGEYSGSEVKLYFNLAHPNVTPRQISENQVKQIAAAMGVTGQLSSSAMMKKPFLLALKQKEYNGNVSNEYHYANKVPDLSPAKTVEKDELHKGLDDDIPF